MKVLLILLVVLGIAYYFYSQREQTPPPAQVAEAAKQPEPASTPAATPPGHGFDSLIVLLKHDMDNIPAPLDGPGPVPNNAIAIRRRVGPYENSHPEYRTLAQACDLIIGANDQRAALQQACHTEQTRASFGASLNSTGSMDHAVPAKHATVVDPKKPLLEIHQRVEGSWTSYRAQTAGQVQSLLGSLVGKQL